jgi:uncharacterized protein (DUF302 family)
MNGSTMELWVDGFTTPIIGTVIDVEFTTVNDIPTSVLVVETKNGPVRVKYQAISVWKELEAAA